MTWPLLINRLCLFYFQKKYKEDDLIKYAHYSELTGFLLYIAFGTGIIIWTFFCNSLTTDKHQKRRNFIYGALSCLFLAGDMVIWLNSWVYPPFAMPYDKNGEQTTIFTNLYGITNLLQTILSFKIIANKLKNKRKEK
jgi:hypothetical protein